MVRRLQVSIITFLTSQYLQNLKQSLKRQQKHHLQHLAIHIILEYKDYIL